MKNKIAKDLDSRRYQALIMYIVSFLEKCRMNKLPKASASRYEDYRCDTHMELVIGDYQINVTENEIEVNGTKQRMKRKKIQQKVEEALQTIFKQLSIEIDNQ